MKSRIISYMREFGSITQQEANINLGCSRLSEYIRQIRIEYDVPDKWEYGTNRWGSPTKWKRYFLGEEK